MQDSHSTASLRGIHAVRNSVAWATGTDGTILRTQDGGAHWQRCTPPAGAEKLDFRGVWVWSAKIAAILSSGPGDASRVYLTTDACAHWTEQIRNEDKDGFWDAVAFETAFGSQARAGILIGDPVNGRFATYTLGCESQVVVGTELLCRPRRRIGICREQFGGVRLRPAELHHCYWREGRGRERSCHLCWPTTTARKDLPLAVELPLAGGTDSAGAFSVAFRDPEHGVVVGGDYKKPELAAGTAAWTEDGGRHWAAASKPPYMVIDPPSLGEDPQAKVWIAGRNER